MDLESMGLEWTKSEITCICAKDQSGNRFGSAGADEIMVMEDFINWITEISNFKSHKLVTYNGRMFDIPYIIGRLSFSDRTQETGRFLLNYNHFDIFAFIKKLTKKNMSLDTVAKLLGCKNLKSGSGAGAVELAKQGKWKELKEYCNDDVDATEELYLKLRDIRKR
jgi:uncharacterized protein YprB with RNaseH-like and TPR domain